MLRIKRDDAVGSCRENTETMLERCWDEGFCRLNEEQKVRSNLTAINMRPTAVKQSYRVSNLVSMSQTRLRFWLLSN